MKKILVLLAFLLIPASALAQSTPPLCVSEIDGSPSKCGITRIKVSNGSLTISGNTATITTGGGGGGGLTVGTTTITSGTAGRFLYETSGNVLGEVSTLTSDGTILTFSPTVTTGTGATSGLNANANSLTTGDAFNFASSSVTSGNVFKISATGTAAASNTKTALNVATSGANATSTQTTYGAQISNTSTGTSSTNVGARFSASGGSTNYSIQTAAGDAEMSGGDILVGTGQFTSRLIGNAQAGVGSFTGIGVLNGSAGSRTLRSGMYVNGDDIRFVENSGEIARILNGAGLLLASNYYFGFNSGTSLSSGAVDTAIARAAAGVIRATNGSTGAGGLLVGSSSATGTAGSLVVASANADSLTVGPNGLTNPILQVVGNVASAATGLSVTGNAAGSGVTLTALSSGTNESIILVGKGTGQVVVPNGSAAAPGLAIGNATSGLFGNSGTTLQLISNGGAGLEVWSGGQVNISQNFTLGWGSSGISSSDTFLRRRAAASLALGAADAAAPVAQTLSVQNVVAGTTNTAGVDWTRNASIGTGTGAGGKHIWRVAGAGSSGTAQNSLATVLQLTPAASAATGLEITSNAAGSGVTLTALSSGSNEGISLVPKGSGQVVLGNSGQSSVTLASALSGANDALMTFGNAAITFDPANIGVTQRFSNTAVVHGSGIHVGWGSLSTGNTANDSSFVRANPAVIRVADGSTGAGTFSSVALTPAQITADQNNYAPGVGWFQRWSSDASRNVTGLAAGVDGQVAEIWNIGSNNIVFVNESASSTAANRFTTSTGADLTLSAAKCAQARYDSTSARWRVRLCN